MKNIILVGLVIVLFTACNQKQRYTQSSPEIDVFKSVIQSYNDQDWEGMTAQYADTAKTFNNSSDIGISLADMVDIHKQSLSNLSSRGFLDKDQEYEMVVTDKGATWVNFWGDWEGTLKANGKKIKIPIHLTGQFKEGKIVRTSGNWDNAPMVLALQEIEKNNNLSTDEKAIMSGVGKLVESWNTKDLALFKSVTDDNFVRNTNGVAAARNQEEYTDMMAVFHTAFPDFKVTINDYFVKDGKAHLNWTVTGTNTGVFMENAATGKKVRTHGYSIMTFNTEGKGTREDAFFDNMELFSQMGYTVSPPPQ